MVEVQSIKAILREVSTVDKSLELQTADFILRPLNVVLKIRTVVEVGPNLPWVKESRTNQLGLKVLSYVGTVVFAPLIMVVLYLKAQSDEQKYLIGTYKFNKWNARFTDRVQKVNRNNLLEGFSFDLQSKPASTTQTVAFTWYGKMKAKDLI